MTTQTITLDGIEYNLTPVTETISEPKKPVQDPNVLHMTVMPNDGEIYHYIDLFGLLCKREWRTAENFLYMFNNHNCYATEKNAHLALSIQKAKVELQNIASELNDGREINWADGNQAKCKLHYNYKQDEIRHYYYQSDSDSGIICIKESFLEVAFERMGKAKLKLALEVYK